MSSTCRFQLWYARQVWKVLFFYLFLRISSCKSENGEVGQRFQQLLCVQLPCLSLCVCVRACVGISPHECGSLPCIRNVRGLILYMLKWIQRHLFIAAKSQEFWLKVKRSFFVLCGVVNHDAESFQKRQPIITCGGTYMNLTESKHGRASHSESTLPFLPT